MMTFRLYERFSQRDFFAILVTSQINPVEAANYSSNSSIF